MPTIQRRSIEGNMPKAKAAVVDKKQAATKAGKPKPAVKKPAVPTRRNPKARNRPADPRVTSKTPIDKTKKINLILPRGEFGLASYMKEEFDALAIKYEMIGGTRSLDRASTGSLVLDLILGGGITPTGMCIFAGGEGSGKTTTLTHSLGEALTVGLDYAAINDAENTLDVQYMQQSLGKAFDTDLLARLEYHDQNLIEQYFDFVRGVLRGVPDKVWSDDTNSFVYRLHKDNKSHLKLLGVMLDNGAKEDKKLSDKRYHIIPSATTAAQGFLALDSFPALITGKADERESDEGGGMSERARVLADILPKVAGRLRRKGFFVAGTNQLREKPGVMYGCMLYTTPVLLADGTTMPIGKIVNQKLPVEVMSYNKDTGKIEPKHVTNWWNNGLAEQGEYVRLVFDRSNNGPGGDKVSVIVTQQHKVFTPNGLKAVRDLRPGSKILSRAASAALNYDQQQVLLGCLLGDSTLRFSNDGLVMRIKHSDDQSQLLGLKAAAFPSQKANVAEPYTTKDGKKRTLITHVTNMIRRDAIPTDLFGVTKRGQHSVSRATIAKMDLAALAVWYMSDGHYHVTYKGDPVTTEGSHHIKLSCSRFDTATKALLAARIEALTGAKLTVHASGLFAFNKEACSAFHTAVFPYLTEDMVYKAPCKSGKLHKYKWDFKTASEQSDAEIVEVIAVEPYDVFSRKNRTKYDIQVEDNSSYIVAGRLGLVVHNSPLYESMGNTFRYYTAQRTWFTTRAVDGAPGTWQKDKENGALCVEDNPLGGRDYYSFKGITNVKNKVGQPFLKGWMRIWTGDPDGLGRGIDPVFDCWEYLRMTGQVSGARTGKAGFKVLLPKHKDLAPMTWNQFKIFILAEKFGGKYAKTLRENGFSKQPKMLEECRAQLKPVNFAKPKAIELMAAARLAKSSSSKDDLSDDE